VPTGHLRHRATRTRLAAAANRPPSKRTITRPRTHAWAPADPGARSRNRLLIMSTATGGHKSLDSRNRLDAPSAPSAPFSGATARSETTTAFPAVREVLSGTFLSTTPPCDARSALHLPLVALALGDRRLRVVAPVSGQGSSDVDLLIGELSVRVAANEAFVTRIRFNEFSFSCPAARRCIAYATSAHASGGNSVYTTLFTRDSRRNTDRRRGLTVDPGRALWTWRAIEGLRALDR
jgi:hypothetical protein